MPQARGTFFVVTKTDGVIQSYADHVFRSCSPSWFRNSNLIKDSKPGRQYAKACVEDGRYGVARIVFGAEPSDEKILQFVVGKWEKLSFFGGESTETSKPAKNPKRRAREAAKTLKRPPSYEAGPASLQAPTGGRYSTPCGTPSPTEVKRTRKPYSESRGFRQVVYTTKGRFQCA